MRDRGPAPVPGSGVRAIAAQLGRSPSTVSRELRRNRRSWQRAVPAVRAQRLAARRRARPGRGKLIRDPVLREFVAGRLAKRWSPEQISQALRGEFPGDRARHLVHETIYQAVYRPELAAGCAGTCPAAAHRAAASQAAPPCRCPPGRGADGHDR